MLLQIIMYICCLNCVGYLFESEVYWGGGDSVDLSQKGGATQKTLGTTDLDYINTYKSLLGPRRPYIF